MAAARQRAFKVRSTASGSRIAAIAAVQINWKKMMPDGDREDRLAWISEFLGQEVHSLTDLTDQQLGAVAGEMKRLTGHTSPTSQTTPTRLGAVSGVGKVVQGEFGRPSDENLGVQASGLVDAHQTIHLASTDQVYTLDKLASYIAWTEDHLNAFLHQRFKCSTFRMLTFKQANSCTTALLRIAAHRDLKKRKGDDKPVSRAEINKYIPLLKAELRIDQAKR